MGTNGAAGGGIGSIIFLVAMLAIMYFIMIKPQQKKEKELKSMRDSLKVGDDIVTIGGIYGKIVNVKDETVTVAVGAEKTKLVFAKWAISGLDKQSGESGGAKKARKEEVEETKKPSPKNIKKLGAKTEEAVETAEEAVKTASEE